MTKQLYLVVSDCDSRMGAKSDYQLLTIGELKKIRDGGVYMEVYKVEKVSKKDRKSLEIGKSYKEQNLKYYSL